MYRLVFSIEGEGSERTKKAIRAANDRGSGSPRTTEH